MTVIHEITDLRGQALAAPVRTYDTPEERAEYGRRLMRRVFDACNEIGPVGLGGNDSFFEALAPAETSLFAKLDAWEQGQIDKTELDNAATGFLEHYRKNIPA
jgi:hypothetical protein